MTEDDDREAMHELLRQKQDRAEKKLDDVVLALMLGCDQSPLQIRNRVEVAIENALRARGT